ncbi:MAG TPA: hypothetical protein VEJ63_09435 [Planctomycetota bacterium]|nr:hypothetical protein [Planctomycetota bacterium]
MGRIACYAINGLGLYMVMSARNYEEEATTRTVIGFILIGIGTLGILAINFWPRKKQEDSSEQNPG